MQAMPTIKSYIKGSSASIAIVAAMAVQVEKVVDKFFGYEEAHDGFFKELVSIAKALFNGESSTDMVAKGRNSL